MERRLETAPHEAAGTESARERIPNAAARLYAIHGYEGTSMRQIALEAGVTKPLIFYHFESKERLFSSLLREAIDAYRNATQEVLAHDTPSAERIRGLLRSHVTLARRGLAVYAFAYETLTMPGLLPLEFDYKAEGRGIFRDIVEVIEDGQARGELRGLNPGMVAVVILSSVGMWVSAVLSGEAEDIPDDLDDSLCDLIMRGLEEVRG